MNRQNELKLFYNDIKYVTRSLTRDSEALYCCMAGNSKRYQQKNPREVEAFMRDEEKRLEGLRQSIQKIRKISKRGKQKFHLNEWTSFKELDDLLEKQIGITPELKPSEWWFDRTNYDEILDILDEVQTKTEDSVRSSKRINKVWSDEVFQAHNVRFTIEYVDMLGKSSKYFNTNYWKYKKHLKTLFIEDEFLYSDEEIKLLKKNVATMTENDNWLFFKKKRIIEVLGENYIGKETDFNLIRKNYDRFYSWLIGLPNQAEITCDQFSDYCEYISELQQEEYTDYFQMIHEYMPFYTLDLVYQTPFEQMEQQITDYQHALKIIQNQYGISYLQEMKELFSLDKWNKLVQRVLEKDQWLRTRQDRIEEVFGGIYQGYSTDWEQMKECIEQAAVLINGIPERRIRMYGFAIKEKKAPDTSQMFTCIEEAVTWMLQEETSIPVTEFVKKCSKMLGHKRMTQKFKKEMEKYLETSLPANYNVEDGFVTINDEQEIQFYIPRDNEKREVDLISDKEMKFGVAKIIEVEKEITLDNLTKVISNLLGYPRRTKNIQARVELAIKQLKNEGAIIRNSGGWRLLGE